jgi:CubicO group peptidase (beta-lactamase class C family)
MQLARTWPGQEWEALELPRHLLGCVADIRTRATRIASYALFATVGGRVALQHGAVSAPVEMQSVRKALMSALIGRAVADGKLSLDCTMDELGIDDVDPALTPQEKQATIRDCLMGRSGIYHEAAYEPTGQSERRPARGSHARGEHWFYNNWDFNVLATVLHRATGLDTFRAFQDWFARPMKMQDFDPGACRYLFEACSRHPAYLFAMSARDLARFGHLYLCKGAWADGSPISESWVTQSVHPHSEATDGYELVATAFGLMWWVIRPEVFGGLQSYAALGGSGHGMFILPDIDAVIVHRNDGEATAPSWPEILPLLASTVELCRDLRRRYEP